MSYFIGFLIFVATFATTNQALAVDNPMLVHDAGAILSHIGFRILGFSFIIGMFLSNIIQSPELTNKISLGHTLLNIVISGTLCAILTFLGLMVIVFVRIMLEVDIWHMIFNYLLDTENKHDSLIFIGAVMGGLLAAINATIIYFRFSSQERKNVLTDKGLIEDRFKFATKELVSENSIMLISVFHQFYYLAKHHYVHDFRKNIFHVLCSYLHDINSKAKNKTKTNIETHEGDNPTKHYQKLLEALFMSDDSSSIGFRTRLRLSKACPFLLVNINPQFPFAKFNVDLQDVCFKNSDLSNAYFVRATFKDVNFEGANLEGADFRYANFIYTKPDKQEKQKKLEKLEKLKGANFYGVMVNGERISPEEFFQSYKKEQVVNLMFILTIIMSGLVAGKFFWNWPINAFEGYDAWKVLFASLGGILGMFLGAPLYTFLINRLAFCCRIIFRLNRLMQQYPLLFPFVIICALVFCLLLLCWQADNIMGMLC